MNWKRFAIKFADLKDQCTYNQINKVFGYLIDFPMQPYPNPGFTSTKAELIYQWTLTIADSALSEEQKMTILKDAIEDLIKNENDKEKLKPMLSASEVGREAAIKEVIRYIEKPREDEETTIAIDDYLPISFFDDKNNDYIEHIKSACIQNLQNGNYQFAYIAYYMLFVSYLYKTVWELRTIGDARIVGDIEAFVQLKLERDLNIIFDFSAIKESEFLGKLNNFIRCLHSNETDEIVNFVQKRNHCAHPSGIIQYNQSEVENLLRKIDAYVVKIQSKIDAQLLQYIKNNPDAFGFTKSFLLSKHEIRFLYEHLHEILDFPSNSRETLERKLRFVQVFIAVSNQDCLPQDYLITCLRELFSGYVSGEYSVYETIQSLGDMDSSIKKELLVLIEPLPIDEQDKMDTESYLKAS